MTRNHRVSEISSNDIITDSRKKSGNFIPKKTFRNTRQSKLSYRTAHNSTKARNYSTLICARHSTCIEKQRSKAITAKRKRRRGNQGRKVVVEGIRTMKMKCRIGRDSSRITRNDSMKLKMTQPFTSTGSTSNTAKNRLDFSRTKTNSEY